MSRKSSPKVDVHPSPAPCHACSVGGRSGVRARNSSSDRVPRQIRPPRSTPTQRHAHAASRPRAPLPRSSASAPRWHDHHAVTLHKIFHRVWQETVTSSHFLRNRHLTPGLDAHANNPVLFCAPICAIDETRRTGLRNGSSASFREGLRSRGGCGDGVATAPRYSVSAGEGGPE